MKKLFINGNILSLDAVDTIYQAIGIDGDRIVFLGTIAEVQGLLSDYEAVHDLDGMTVLPGFNDSHMHLLNYGYALSKFDLTEFSSIEVMIPEAQAWMERQGITGGRWLLGRGWNQDRLIEHRFPTKADLDQISMSVPIVLTRVCGHISVCNTKALEYIDLEAASSDSNVDLERGLFFEEGLNMLYNAIPSPSLMEIQEMILETGKLLIEQGITSVQSDDLRAMPDQDADKVLAAYEALSHEKRLPVRVYQQCLFFKPEAFEAFVQKGYHSGQGDAFFKIGPLKLLIDGSLGGRTALLQADYDDAPGERGVASFTQEAVNDMSQCAVRNGFQIAAHAIGDGAMVMAMEGIESALAYAGKDGRHGIVHAQITSKAILERMRKLNLIAYVQPIFLDYDLHIVYDRVGTRADESYAFGTMKRLGIPVAFGTDAPVVSFNPFENLYSAISRKDLNGMPAESYLPGEAFSVLDALKAYTQVGAYCSFEEDLKGTLEIGKLADFIALKQDPLTATAEAIKTMQVEMTVLGGEVVYERE